MSKGGKAEQVTLGGEAMAHSVLPRFLEPAQATAAHCGAATMGRSRGCPEARWCIRRGRQRAGGGGERGSQQASPACRQRPARAATRPARAARGAGALAGGSLRGGRGQRAMSGGSQPDPWRQLGADFEHSVPNAGAALAGSRPCSDAPALRRSLPWALHHLRVNATCHLAPRGCRHQGSYFFCCRSGTDWQCLVLARA